MSTFGIRPYRLDDLDEIHAAAEESRQHVGRWMSWLTPAYSREDAEQWVDYAVASWQREEAYEHVIFDAADQTIIGSCGLNLLNRKDMVCNLGYWVRASRLGEGAARQATLLLRDLGFGVLGFNRLEIVIANRNRFSRNIAESVEATYEGIQKLRLKVGEIAHDAHMYAFLNPAARRE